MINGKVINGPWCFDGFRVNFVIVFVIVLCHVNSPHLWDTLTLGLLKKDGGAHSARIMMVTYVDTYIHIHTANLQYPKPRNPSPRTLLL